MVGSGHQIDSVGCITDAKRSTLDVNRGVVMGCVIIVRGLYLPATGLVLW